MAQRKNVTNLNCKKLILQKCIDKEKDWRSYDKSVQEIRSTERGPQFLAKWNVTFAQNFRNLVSVIVK